MVTRSQLRLLRSILGLRGSCSSGRVARQEPCVACPNFYSPETRPSPTFLLTPSRHFNFSSALSKKGKAPKDAPVPDNAAERGRRSEIDPFDYSELESGISKAMVRLKEALTKTRSAGRISPETIENLPVQLNVERDPGTSGKESQKESGRLGDYATVVPKGGRTMQVFVAEENVWPPSLLPSSLPRRKDLFL